MYWIFNSNFDIVYQSCIDKLKARFTEKSLRFRRLLGMRFEAQGKLDEAQEVYDTILQEDDTNMVKKKRKNSIITIKKLS